MIHGNAALVAIAAFPAAALSGLALAATLSLIAFASSLLPVFVRPSPPILFGLSERVLTVAYVAWLALVGVTILRSGPPTRPKVA
jgi:hypothetical protein